MNAPGTIPASPPIRIWERGYWLPALLLCVMCFHLVTLRSGVYWHNDLTIYLQQAENLVEGRPVADTGVIPNRKYNLSPPAYPPGYPALLAPVVALFGFDETALNVEAIAIFVAFLGTLAWLVRPDLPAPYVAALLVIVGFNPFFWDFKYRLTSEVPFLLFATLALLAYRKSTAPERGHWPVWTLLAVFFLAITILTRSLGVVLAPILLLHDLWRFRRPSPPLLLILGLAGLACLAFVALRGGIILGSTYEDLVEGDLVSRWINDFSATLGYVPHQTIGYARKASTLWTNGYSRLLTWCVYLIALGLALVGFTTRFRKGPSVVEFYVVLYSLALLPWSFSETRYLVPILPFGVFYTLCGVSEVTGRRYRWVAYTGLATLSLVYVARYSTLDFGPIPDIYRNPQADSLFAFVRDHTDPDDVLIANRSMVFFTKRPVSPLHRASPAEQISYLETVRARYVIEGPDTHASENAGDLLRLRPDRFRQVFQSGSYALYRFDPRRTSP